MYKYKQIYLALSIHHKINAKTSMYKFSKFIQRDVTTEDINWRFSVVPLDLYLIAGHKAFNTVQPSNRLARKHKVYLCDCGIPQKQSFAPCCSLDCWSNKFES